MAALFYFSWGTANAQEYQLLRYDENYSDLRDSARTFYNRLKYSQLSTTSYLSVGGEVRYEFAGKTNEDWLPDRGFNGSLLQRYSIYTDFHLGQWLRIFGQLNSGLENGSKYEVPPVDEDHLAVQNLFADVKVWRGNEKNFTIRLGRQELNYGSGRLISVREGTNVRLYFTGAKVMYNSPRFAIDGFVMMTDKVNPGVFDNQLSRQANLWGTYAYLIIPRGGNFDFYYLGIRRDNAVFNEGIAREIRHTVATRYWKYGGGFIYNLEAAYQFGTFGTGNINAWTAAIELGYRFDDSKFKPTINIRNDYVSGDKKNGDGHLQTFNPLFPRSGYFGFNPLIGPANLIDLHPYGTVNITEKLVFQADVVFNWRYSLEDGLYLPSGTYKLSGLGSQERYIGTTYLASADLEISRSLSMSVGAQYFQIGKFIRERVEPAVSSTFFNYEITFKF
jgi:hypothetical protein